MQEGQRIATHYSEMRNSVSFRRVAVVVVVSHVNFFRTSEDAELKLLRDRMPQFVFPLCSRLEHRHG